MQNVLDIIYEAIRYLLPILGSAVLIYCAMSLLRHRFPAPERAYLTEVSSGESVQLQNWENAIGRSNACDVVSQNETVSRFHAVIARRKKGWTVIDTYSKTGIFINGHRIDAKAILENGDTVAFGSAAYKFQID